MCFFVLTTVSLDECSGKKQKNERKKRCQFVKLSEALKNRILKDEINVSNVDILLKRDITLQSKQYKMHN